MLAVLNAVAKLGELAFYPPPTAGAPPPLANEVASKACVAAAQSLGLKDDKALAAALARGAAGGAANNAT